MKIINPFVELIDNIDGKKILKIFKEKLPVIVEDF